LDTFARHHSTNATNNQQNNVVEHLGKRLIHWSHALDGLNYESQAIQHEDNDSCKDDSHDKDDCRPNTDFNFLCCQKPLELKLGVVGQFASPVQVLQGNQDSLG
jgi:hypothetical protein